MRTPSLWPTHRSIAEVFSLSGKEKLSAPIHKFKQELSFAWKQLCNGYMLSPPYAWSIALILIDLVLLAPLQPALPLLRTNY